MLNPLNPERINADLPAMLDEVKKLDGRQIIAAAEQAADVIACGADMLWMAKVPRNAEVQPDEVHHAIVAGVAILAQRPNGVDFAGLHWCVNGHSGERGVEVTCPGPGEWALPAEVGEAKVRGAVFTPRSLAEEVANGALECLAFNPGPLQTGEQDQWRVASSVELLGLKVGDIAAGSGVFPIAACRYLADRLVEAWFDEAAHPRQELPPWNPMTMAARRLVMRCLYASDIDPTSVELCRLALALLTPTVPLDLTDQIVCGDSLLGISTWRDIQYMNLDASGSPVFDRDELSTIFSAFKLGNTELASTIADLTVGAELRCAGAGVRAREATLGEARHLGRRLYESPDVMPAARAAAREWLDTDLPEGNASRNPLHWPLAFPGVFPFTLLPRTLGSSLASKAAA